MPTSPNPGDVREQLERILKSPAFRNSQRHRVFLRHCVEQALEGRQDGLKERLIGVEVFGRPPDYDTGTDHVVRSAAGELRKRLAQYYTEAPAAQELRIDLFPGSYVPRFTVPAPVVPESTADAGGAAAPRRERARLRRLAPVFAGLLLPVLPLWWYFAQNRGQTALDQFWAPVLAARAPVTLSVGDLPDAGELPVTASTTVLEMHQLGSNRINFASAATLARLAGLLQSRGAEYRILQRAGTKFSDLQDGPSILVGGFNNAWTLRLTDTLRFRFEQRDGSQLAITDRQNPGRRDWAVDFSKPYRMLTRDFAIVSRVLDPKTERPTVIVAGVGYWGTQAAGEFITRPDQLRKLEGLAPRSWSGMNLQVVLSTDIIDGVSGPPKILAAQFW